MGNACGCNDTGPKSPAVRHATPQLVEAPAEVIKVKSVFSKSSRPSIRWLSAAPTAAAATPSEKPLAASGVHAVFSAPSDNVAMALIAATLTAPSASSLCTVGKLLQLSSAWARVGQLWSTWQQLWKAAAWSIVPSFSGNICRCSAANYRTAFLLLLCKQKSVVEPREMEPAAEQLDTTETQVSTLLLLPIWDSSRHVPEPTAPDSARLSALTQRPLLLRFQFRAVAALVHDICMTQSLYSLASCNSRLL